MVVFWISHIPFDSVENQQYRKGDSINLVFLTKVTSCIAQHLITHDLPFTKNGKIVIDFTHSVSCLEQASCDFFNFFLGSVNAFEIKIHCLYGSLNFNFSNTSVLVVILKWKKELVCYQPLFRERFTVQNYVLEVPVYWIWKLEIIFKATAITL